MCFPQNREASLITEEQTLGVKDVGSPERPIVAGGGGSSYHSSAQNQTGQAIAFLGFISKELIS